MERRALEAVGAGAGEREVEEAEAEEEELEEEDVVAACRFRLGACRLGDASPMVRMSVSPLCMRFVMVSVAFKARALGGYPVLI